MLYGIIMGLDGLNATQILRYNGAFQRSVGLPRLPDTMALRRFLKRLRPRHIRQLVRPHEQLRQALFGRPRSRSSRVFDLDSVVLVLYGHAEGAQAGYNPKQRGRRSYLPLLCFDGVTRDVWAGSLHAGNTHVTSVTLPLLGEAWAKLPPTAREVRARADGAFFDHKLVEWLEARGARYVIVARLTAPIQHRVSTLRYARVSGTVAAAEFRYQPQG